MSVNTIIGQKNNYLTIIGEDRDKAGRKYVTVKCDCGNIKRIQYGHWKSGKIKSCGCMRLQLLSKAAAKADPIYSHRLHTIWTHMKQRCYNENADNYERYGGRGISVCEEWKNDYPTFYKWALSNGYADNLTIDRIDVDGNYEPDNCRWANNETQQLNTRRGKKYLWTIDGETKHALEWCKHFGISLGTAKYRVNVMGLSPKEALTRKKYA